MGHVFTYSIFHFKNKRMLYLRGKWITSPYTHFSRLACCSRRFRRGFIFAKCRAANLLFWNVLRQAYLGYLVWALRTPRWWCRSEWNFGYYSHINFPGIIRPDIFLFCDWLYNLASLRDALIGMKAQLLPKGGSVNTLCERFFSICRSLALRQARFVHLLSFFNVSFGWDF